MGKENDFLKMVPFCGNNIYLDIQNLVDFLVIKQTEENKQIITTTNETFKNGNGEIINENIIENISDKERQLDNVKFEMVKYLLESLTLEQDLELDESLGEAAITKLSLPAKLAYNTLAGHGLLKKYK